MSMLPFPQGTEPVFLMDGSAYIYRAYFANRSLQRSDGFPTGALVPVTRLLLRILRQERPRWFVFVKDGHGGNFRRDIYPAYKQSRQTMPDDLACQLDPIRRMVEALGLRYLLSDGCEADDCIASLALRYSKERPVVIVSGDKDLKQCLSENVYMWDLGSKKELFLDLETFEKKEGVPPSLWADMQALMGDRVDDIPGIEGIGIKTAKQIMEICPGLESIRDRLVLLPAKAQKMLEGHIDDLFLWRRLTRLATDRCADMTMQDARVSPINVEAAMALAKEFELFSQGDLILSVAEQERREGTYRQEPAASVQSAPAAEAAPVEPSAEACPERKPAAPSAGANAAPLETEIATLGKGTAGLSLLDVASLAGSKAWSKMETVSLVSALPPCGGKAVSLVWPANSQTSVCVGVLERGCDVKAASEFLWDGEEAGLAGWAAGADELVVVDAKKLLGRDSPWRAELGARAAKGRGLFDLGLAAYIFDPESGDYSWERLALRARNLAGDLDNPGPGVLALLLLDAARRRLERDCQTDLYYGLEMPLLPVLADMEEAGVAIDKASFAGFLEEAQSELSRLESEIYYYAGQKFNIRSSQQLADLLYVKLGLPAGKKTRGGKISTRQEELEALSGKHPVVDRILRHRKLEKLRSSYLAPLPALADGRNRIHTTFDQKATATGRLSSKNPNLQNVPVRGDMGRRMRACFVAGEGNLLVSCDYSQIELRVLAHMSGDPELLASFGRGEDIHARTAALIYEEDVASISPDQRRVAKTINFGLLYGMGAQKLARELGMGVRDARTFIDRYFEKLGSLKAFYEGVEADALKNGYVTTMGGRRRYLPGIASEHGQESSMARRQAVNTVIQGSAADIIKIAMLLVANDARLRELGARMVLQIHDELLFEVPEAFAREAGMRVCSLMESVRPGGVELLLPLTVDSGVAKDWGEAH